MFFVLSGFIICWAMPQDYSLKLAGRFIARRITRIEPPYIVSIVLALAAHFIFIAHYKPDWLNVLFHLGYINSFVNSTYLNPVYWTLAIEFQFYLFVAIFFPLLIKRWSVFCLIFLCIAPVWVRLPGSTLINVFPIFVIGIIFFLYKRGVWNISATAIYILVIVACCVFRLGWLQTSAALLALLLLALPLKSNRIVSFFSKISFSLYLTHDIVGSNLVVYLGTQLPKTFFFKGIEFITGIAVSIIFAYIFCRLIEEPSLKLSKRIRYNA